MMKTSSAKIKPKTPKQFKTDFDDSGRVCTKCGIHKPWEDFGEVKSKNLTTGRTSSCKQCKKEKRKAVGRDIKREKFCAKKRKKELEKEDPYLLKARTLRSSLLSRVKDPAQKALTPKTEDIKSWLLGSELICYYSGEKLSIKNMTVDHKTPLTKGGTNELNNLCLASHHMNTAKGGMTEEEFRSLLTLISTWADKGEGLLRRLKQGYFG